MESRIVSAMLDRTARLAFLLLTVGLFFAIQAGPVVLRIRFRRRTGNYVFCYSLMGRTVSFSLFAPFSHATPKTWSFLSMRRILDSTRTSTWIMCSRSSPIGWVRT